jgi:lipopolysaccharide transport system ATP-binding protein
VGSYILEKWKGPLRMSFEMETPIISVKNLSKRYLLGLGGGERYRALRDVMANRVKNLFKRNNKNENPQEFWALKEINFDVRAGEKLGIIGRNGAGKSTLLKILSEITEPTDGEAHIYGRVASLLEVGTGFHPELTGKDNIFMNGAILGMRRAEIKKKFDEIVCFAEIERFLDTPVKRYSSGMYVRLAFAVAAHLEPEILIVDEVLAVGDMAFQKKCLGKMGEIAKGGRTVIFVSHNMGAIQSLCNSAILLDNGKITKKGSVSEVVKDYETRQMKHLNEVSFVVERSPEDIKQSKFYVSRVEMQDANGEHTNLFKYNDKIILIVDFVGVLASGPFSSEFYVYNEMGQLVAVGASGPYHGIFFNVRVRRIKIEIGPLILTSGNYSISFSVVGDIRTDTWGNAIFFTISECQPFAANWDIPSFREGVCVLQQSFSEVN